jgi:dUTP pyrophosphatase
MIKFKLEPGTKLPKRGSPGAAGLDICANELTKIYPRERKLIQTGVKLADCPEGVYLRVAPRSKLANRYGINVLAGVVDADYRGEIGVILHNTGDEIIAFRKGDAIAQLIPTKIEYCEVLNVTEVTKTERGEAGINDKDLRL